MFQISNGNPEKAIIIHKEDNMTINLIFRIAAVGILVSVLNQILKQSGREEQAFLTTLAGLILVLFWIVPYISELFEIIRNLFTL
jgi:stage III sporulation protein AC